MTGFFPLIYFGLGLLIGSFINAAVYRVKKKKDLWFGRSICPNCKHVLAPLDLIPLLSYIFLWGRCRYCRKKISIQYPIVELTVGVLYYWNYLFYLRFPDPSSQLYGYLGLVILPLMIFILVYDLKYQLILNKTVFSTFIIAAIYLIARFYFIPRELTFEVVTERLLSAAGLFAFFYALFALGKGRWMGGGDVKLVPVFGLFLGYLAYQAVFLAFISGSIISVMLMMQRKKTLKSAIPFGPFLVFGFILTFFLMDRIWVYFINLFDRILFT